jgi:hypothetical protein
VLYELYVRNIKIFKMAAMLIVTFVSAAITLIIEGTDRRYKEARKEIEECFMAIPYQGKPAFSKAGLLKMFFDGCGGINMEHSP